MDQPGSHTLIRGNQPAADRMRELLARTVQDQFTDQRSNAGALEDIRQRMEGLEWLVKEVREREVPGMTAQLDELARRLDETMQKPPQWAESLAEHMELLRSQVAPVAELTQRTGQLDKEISAVKGHAEVSFWALTAKVDQTAEAATRQFTQSLEAVSGSVEGLSGQVAGIGGQVDLIGGQVQAVHGRIERLDERLADTDDKLGALDGRLGEHGRGLTSVEGKLSAGAGPSRQRQWPGSYGERYVPGAGAGLRRGTGRG